MAAVLTGAWRPVPSPLRLLPDEFASAASLLLATGAGGLGWWRVRGSPLADTPAGHELHQAFLFQSGQALLHEGEVSRAFELLKPATSDAVLGKGWAIARCYPQPGLRWRGDVDIYVPASQRAAAEEALRSPGGGIVDLHTGFGELSDRDAREIRTRAVRVQTGSMDVTVLGPEDHLRLLALHMLRHSVLRPVWLCDVAVALETRPADFDWDYFAWGARRPGWPFVALELAHRLLGASVDGVPSRLRLQLAEWIIPAVLRQWGVPRTHVGRRPLESYFARPEGLVEALRVRWPNAVEATVTLGAPFNRLPRLPFQVANYVWRGTRFATRVVRTAVRARHPERGGRRLAEGH